MDSGSIGDLKEIKDSMEEEVPKILSPEIRDVFHVFVSMLDPKSFMKLAVTSKEMRKRCMESKNIKISVHSDKLNVLNRNGSAKLQLNSDIEKLNRCHLVGGQKVCVISVKTVVIEDHFEPQNSMEVVHRLKEIGVNKVYELNLRGNPLDSETVITIVKDFGVKSVNMVNHIFGQNVVPVDSDLLRSLFHQNLEKLSYDRAVPVDLILDINSPILEISFPDFSPFSQEQFREVLSKIQSGSIRRLTVAANSVNWGAYDSVPYYFQDPLPDERPLLITRPGSNRFPVDEYWFLHWNGGVTKCIQNYYTLDIFKCAPWEYPWILRKDEDILKDLQEKRPRVFCTLNIFKDFFARLIMVDPSHKEPLPDDRPLYFKVNQNSFWTLDENNHLMNCSWGDSYATWKPYNPQNPEIVDHPALAKLFLRKALKQMEESSVFMVYCKGSYEFDSLFDDFEKLDFEYSGVLSKERPLVFEKASSENTKNRLRVVLSDGRIVQCEYSQCIVTIKNCDRLNRPPILYTARNVMEMLVDDRRLEDMNLNIPFETYRDGLELFKKSILVLQKRLLIEEKTKTEFWYRIDNFFWKVEWKEGLFVLKADSLINDSPPAFMKKFFIDSLENCSSFTLHLEQFRSCLDQFTVVPFDYSGPLANDPPLALVKNGIRHTCEEERGCHCSEVSYVLVLILWENGMRATTCSWEKENVVFGTKVMDVSLSQTTKTFLKLLLQNNHHSSGIFGSPTIDLAEVPVIFKSKEYLENLLQRKYGTSSHFNWFGCYDDFYACLKEYVKLPHDYRGPWPKERRIILENNFVEDDPICFILRKDAKGETINQCTFQGSFVALSLSSSRPLALDRMV